MKIAAATEDSRTVAADFEGASYYAVLTVESGEIVGRELRQKRPQGWYEASGHVEHRGPASAAPETAEAHDMLVDPVDDCDAVLVSGIDATSRSRLEAAGVWPVIVPPGPIDAAAQSLAAGTLVS